MTRKSCKKSYKVFFSDFSQHMFLSGFYWVPVMALLINPLKSLKKNWQLVASGVIQMLIV